MKVRVVAHETVPYILTLDVDTAYWHEDLEAAVDEAWDRLDFLDLQEAVAGRPFNREYISIEKIEEEG